MVVSSWTNMFQHILVSHLKANGFRRWCSDWMYTGRPLSIFERDFDTPLPNEEEPEEFEEWKPHVSEGAEHNHWETSNDTPVQSYTVSCFNASASLCESLTVALYTSLFPR
jgi:hypothetical protein